MNKAQCQVTEFHEAFGFDDPEVPTERGAHVALLRARLIQEELSELTKAMSLMNMAEIADGIADLLYVVYGTAISYGIDIEPIFDEVHRSNMTKVGAALDKAGKVSKPVKYSKPTLVPLLKKQGWITP
jgi:predicted HAD superfamily Cof-like phosphohydrolase